MFLYNNRVNMWPFDESMVSFKALRELFQSDVWENKYVKAPLNEHVKTVIRALSVATPVSRSQVLLFFLPNPSTFSDFIRG